MNNNLHPIFQNIVNSQLQLPDVSGSLLADELISQHEIRVGLEDGGELPSWAVQMIERWRNNR